MEPTRRAWRTNLVVLIIGTLATVFYQLSAARAEPALQHYVGPLCLLFLGVLWVTPHRRSADLYVAAAMLGWYLISRVFNRELYLEDSYTAFCWLLVVYAVGFGFSAMDDPERCAGLRAAGAVLFVAMGVFAWLAVIGVLLRTTLVLPRLGTEFGLANQRLITSTHANPSAAMFLLGLFLGVWLLLSGCGRRLRPLMILLMVGQYAGIALSVSRTVMVQASCAAALALLFFLLRRLKLPRMPRALCAVAAACAALLVVYMSFGVTVQLCNRVALSGAEAEAAVQERPLGKDLATLTGRTDIYRRCFQLMREHPVTLLGGVRGLLDVSAETTPLLWKYKIPYHAHNAYLQSIFLMGIPGLLAALYFSLRAAVLACRVLFVHAARSTPAQKWLAIAAPCLLINAFLEAFLFANYLPLYNFGFFLILGYLREIDRALSGGVRA